MIVQKGKGKMKVVTNDAEVKKLYEDAVNGKKHFSWTGPGSYTTKESIMKLYEAGKLYRPLARSFGLVD
jgi:hypothetical protein